MKKETLKTALIGAIAGAIVTGGTSTVIAYTVNSNNVNFRPTDSAWKVNSVAEAIDDLYIKKTGDNYSNEERVVGTWIDGKPIYQKVFHDNGAKLNRNIDVTSLNIDTLIFTDAIGADRNGVIFTLNSISGNSGMSIGLSANKSTLSFIANTDNNTHFMYYIIARYTKTTDTVENNNQG